MRALPASQRLAIFALAALLGACRDEELGPRGDRSYRSVVLATPISLPGDPSQRSISMIELVTEDLSSGTGRGTIAFDDQPWEIDRFGDARPTRKTPIPALRVELARVPDPERAGNGRVLFALRSPELPLERRIYFSWSPGPQLPSYLLIRGEDDPLPIVVRDSPGVRSALEGLIPYQHILPLLPTGEVDPGDADEPLATSFVLRTDDFNRDPFPERMWEIWRDRRDGGTYSIEGRPGATGALLSNRWPVFFTPFGEEGALGGSWERREVAFIARTDEDPRGQGRRLFELVLQEANPAGDRYFVVLAPTVAGPHRLIVERAGNVRHVLPLFDPHWRKLWRDLQSLARGNDAERRAVLELRRVSHDGVDVWVREGHVSSVTLTGDGCHARALSHLRELPRLETLNLERCAQLTLEMLDQIAELPRLLDLDVLETPLSDEMRARVADIDQGRPRAL